MQNSAQKAAFQAPVPNDAFSGCFSLCLKMSFRTHPSPTLFYHPLQMKKCSTKFFYADSISQQAHKSPDIPFKVALELRQRVQQDLWESQVAATKERHLASGSGKFQLCTTWLS
jgi:hypothetical protein